MLDAATGPAVAEICVRLDGMPLAIELAAARTSALAPAQIALRLDNMLHVLDRGSRSAVTRQQTLHATLAWSHDLLDEEERVLFRRLAVFTGSMALDAVEQVCGGGGLDIVDLLTRLVDKSLVNVERVGGTVRYRVLETIRQFADQQLQAAGERTERTAAHRDWYVAFAQAHDPERAAGVVNDTPSVLEDEHETCASPSSGLADAPEVALQLAVSLWRFWLARGDFVEGSRWLDATLQAAPQRTELRARALLAAAAMEVRRGDATGRLLDLAGDDTVSIMRELGDDRALAETLPIAGLLSWLAEEDWQHAEDLIVEGRALAVTVSESAVAASATHLLGVIAVARGAGAAAESHFVEALALLHLLPANQAPFFPVVTPGFYWESGSPRAAAPAAVHRDRAVVPPGGC